MQKDKSDEIRWADLTTIINEKLRERELTLPFNESVGVNPIFENFLVFQLRKHFDELSSPELWQLIDRCLDVCEQAIEHYKTISDDQFDVAKDMERFRYLNRIQNTVSSSIPSSIKKIKATTTTPDFTEESLKIYILNTLYDYHFYDFIDSDQLIAVRNYIYDKAKIFLNHLSNAKIENIINDIVQMMDTNPYSGSRFFSSSAKTHYQPLIDFAINKYQETLVFARMLPEQFKLTGLDQHADAKQIKEFLYNDLYEWVFYFEPNEMIDLIKIATDAVFDYISTHNHAHETELTPCFVHIKKAIDAAVIEKQNYRFNQRKSQVERAIKKYEQPMPYSSFITHPITSLQSSMEFSDTTKQSHDSIQKLKNLLRILEKERVVILKNHLDKTEVLDDFLLQMPLQRLSAKLGASMGQVLSGSKRRKPAFYHFNRGYQTIESIALGISLKENLIKAIIDYKQSKDYTRLVEWDPKKIVIDENLDIFLTYLNDSAKIKSHPQYHFIHANLKHIISVVDVKHSNILQTLLDTAVEQTQKTKEQLDIVPKQGLSP